MSDFFEKLPTEVLIETIKNKPDRSNVCLINMRFYDAACSIPLEDYLDIQCDLKFKDNSCMILSTNRIFTKMSIKDYNCFELFNMNDDFTRILKKFGSRITVLKLKYRLITENDIRFILSHFPILEKFKIYESTNDTRPVELKPISLFEKVDLDLSFLKEVDASTYENSLNMNVIFDGVRNIEKLRLHGNIMVNNDAFLMTQRRLNSIQLYTNEPLNKFPIEGLTLNHLSLTVPNINEILCASNVLRNQRELTSLQLEIREYGKEFLINNELLHDVGYLINLTSFKFSLDEISGDNNLKRLSKLKKITDLYIHSAKENKIEDFSTYDLVFDYVKTLTINFRVPDVAEKIFIAITKAFPYVEKLCYNCSSSEGLIATNTLISGMKYLKEYIISRNEFENFYDHLYIDFDFDNFLNAQAEEEKLDPVHVHDHAVLLYEANMQLKTFDLDVTCFSSPFPNHFCDFIDHLSKLAPNIQVIETNIEFDSVKKYDPVKFIFDTLKNLNKFVFLGHKTFSRESLIFS